MDEQYDKVIETLEELKHGKELTASLDKNERARIRTEGYIAGLDIAIHRVKQLREQG